MRRGRDSVRFEHQVPLDHLCLLELVVEEFLVKHAHKAVLVVEDVVPDFGLLVAEFGDDVLDYLFVQLVLHPVVGCGSGKQLLGWVVLGVVAGAVLDTHEVVDDVEIVVDHVAARHDVLVVQGARSRTLQRLGVG